MINAGDTGFILIASAMVLLMTPGLAFFYGGLGQRKNVVNTIMSSVFIIGLASVMWILFGYTLSFGDDVGGLGIIGNFKWLAFNGVGMIPGPYAKTIPNIAFAAFQMMFAIITPAIITGAVAGRMKFKALFLFVALWSIIVYYPVAHMVWGEGGFLNSLGVVDFAGGNVVHISSGVSALILAIVIGKRKDLELVSYRTHNIPLVALGTGLLWFGWFGFNAGSALGANGLAAHAFITTNTSAAAAMLSWMFIDYIIQKKTTLIGAVTGAVVGLASITQGAGYVPVWSALIIGALASPICYFAVAVIKRKIGYDDALDAFGCHGVGGIIGAIATGLFANSSINSAVKWDGLVYGNFHLFMVQLLGVVVTIGFAVCGTFICLGIVRIFTPLRVSRREEQIGLDMSEHGESAYPSFNGFD